MSEAVLSGKVAIVTGAGTGLGLGIARELALAGADIAVLERDAGSSETAASELAAHGIRAHSYPTDVSDRAQVDAAFEAALHDLGRLDIVVNNAGISRVGPHTQDVTDEDWHDSVAVMQTGVFYCMRSSRARSLLSAATPADLYAFGVGNRVAAVAVIDVLIQVTRQYLRAAQHGDAALRQVPAHAVSRKDTRTFKAVVIL